MLLLVGLASWRANGGLSPCNKEIEPREQRLWPERTALFQVYLSVASINGYRVGGVSSRGS